MPMSQTRRRSNLESGFTLLEAMIAIVILSFGILSLAAVYAQGIQVANMTQMDYIAEKKAEEAVETIFAARDSHLLLWTNIRNATGLGGGNDGVFLVEPQPLLAAGPDGLYGTLDDDKSNPDVVILDLAMPVMNGLEAARIISSIAPDTTMLMFTMHHCEELLKDARAAGITDVLSKHEGLADSLLTSIRAAVGNPVRQ